MYNNRRKNDFRRIIVMKIVMIIIHEIILNQKDIVKL